MDELVTRISTSTGVDPAVARKAVVIILKFLLAEGPPDKVAFLVDALPGAREAVAGARNGGSNGIMGVFNDLTAAGLGMGDIQGVARVFGTFAREKAGDTAVNDVVGAIPGLSQFV